MPSPHDPKSSETTVQHQSEVSSLTDAPDAAPPVIVSVKAPDELPLLQGLASPAVSPILSEEISHLDPNAERWDSEAFSGKALDQLKEFGSFISKAEGTSNVNLAELLTEEFSCSPLRPAALERTFQGPQLENWRANAQSLRESSRQDFEGASGLQDASQQMLSPFSSAAAVDAHFKIVAVEKLPSGWSTRVMVQVAGPTATGSLQQDSVWNCNWKVDDVTSLPILISLRVVAFEETSFEGDDHVLFVENTRSVLEAVPAYDQQLIPKLEHWRDSLDWRFGLDVASPFGLAVGDANGDGLDDVLICEPGGLPNRLFLQNADTTASDTSALAGIDFLEPCQSALFLDLDNDGDQDLVMASGKNLLTLENEGKAKFQLRSVQPFSGRIRSICAADFDADSQLDVYLCCYLPAGQAALDVGIAMPIPMHDANNGAPNHLLRNTGKLDWVDVTKQVGLDANNRRFSWAAAWEDYDDDGDQDLYVANDFGRNNLYRNDNGKFADVAANAAVEDQAAGMSVAWGDYNHDGRMDLYVGNMFSSAGNRIAFQRRFREGLGSDTNNEYRHFARGNTLFENLAGDKFRDATMPAQAAMGRWSWASLFVDINNDSWEDLVVGNGFITGSRSQDDL